MSACSVGSLLGGSTDAQNPTPRGALPEEELINACRQFLSALGEKDWEAMRRLVAPHATWTFPGEARISGTARGIDAIIAKAAVITAGQVEHRGAAGAGGHLGRGVRAA